MDEHLQPFKFGSGYLSLTFKTGFPLFREHQIQGLFKALFILYQALIKFTLQDM